MNTGAGHRSTGWATNDPHHPLKHLRLDTITNTDGIDYIRRHHITDNIRFHHILANDPDRHLHDHPWDYTTLLLEGSYREHTRDNITDHHPGDLLHRQAEQPHRLELLDGPVLTLFIAGPARRRWGFHTDNGWVHWSDYPDAGVIEVDR